LNGSNGSSTRRLFFPLNPFNPFFVRNML